VFVDCESENQKAAVGPHHRWANGLLFDNVVGTRDFEAHNRLNSGSGHGWAGANTIYWNCKCSYYNIESPRPVAENFAIGCIGDQRKDGYFESEGVPVTPRSLYYQQLQDRLQTNVSKQQAFGKHGDASLQPAIRAVNKIEIRFSLPSRSTYRLSIMTMNGKEICSMSGTGCQGTQCVSIDRKALSCGIYYIQLKTPLAYAHESVAIIR
jgi:hypothetical protein